MYRLAAIGLLLFFGITLSVSLLTGIVAQETVRTVVYMAYTADTVEDLEANLSSVHGLMSNDVFANWFDFRRDFVKTWVYGEFKNRRIQVTQYDAVIERGFFTHNVYVIATVRAENDTDYFIKPIVYSFHVSMGRITQLQPE